MNLEELIFAGLDYIGFEKPDDITVNLIIEVRKYLLQKSEQWYEEKFPEAYRYDIGETREEGDAYYLHDGIEYYLNSDGALESCVLFNDSTNENQKFSPPLFLEDALLKRFCKKYGVGKVNYYVYCYINEMDHFFTYCINKTLLGKEKWDNRVKDQGLKDIRETIEGESGKSKL